MSRRRTGMFHNAKFSDRVFKDIPDNVVKNIRRDLNFVLRRDESQDVRRWNRVPNSQLTEEKEPEFQDRRRNPVRNLKNRQIARPFAPQASNDNEDTCSRRDAGFMTARELLQQRRDEAHATTFADDSGEVPHAELGRKKITRIDNRKHQFSTTSCEQTPTVFKTPDDPKLKQKKENVPIFPSEPDLTVIAEGILEGLPHLTLKNNESMTYAQATNGILRKALSLFFDLDDWSSKPEAVVAANAKTFDLDPVKQMLNQTAPLNISSKSINNSFQLSLFREESPFSAANLLDDCEIDQHMSICSTGEQDLHHEEAKEMEEEMYSMNKEFDEIDRTFVTNDDEPFAFLNESAVNPIEPFMGFKFNDVSGNPAQHNTSFNVSLRRTLYSQTVPQTENVLNLSTESLEKPTFLSPSVVLSNKNSFVNQSSSKEFQDISYNLRSHRKRPAEGSPLFKF